MGETNDFIPSAVLPPEKLPELDALCRHFGVRSLVLFGSANTAAFDPSRSDVDLIAEMDDPRSDDEARFRSYFNLREALEELFGRPVDLVRKSPIRNPYLKRSIERNSRQIFPRT